MNLDAWTDGSGDTRPPKIGGWSAVIVSPSNPFIRVEISGAVHETTSARMEMTAVLMALKWPPAPARIRIHTDSAYIVNCFAADWLSGWRKRNWMTANDTPVKNRDLWEEMERLIAYHTAVVFVKVKGHAGNENNERADKLAGAARRESRKEHDERRSQDS